MLTPSPATPGSFSRIQSTVWRAPLSSGSTDSTADSSALLSSEENTGGETDMMFGALAISWRTVSSLFALSVPAASPPGKLTSTRTGPSAPGPSASAAALTPPRISWVGSNCRCMLLPSTIEKAGAASTSSSAAAPSAAIHGRRITQPVQRVQNRDWVASGLRDQCRYDDRLAAARPNVASTAGVSVVDASTATATARIAPVAIDTSTGVSMR